MSTLRSGRTGVSVSRWRSWRRYSRVFSAKRLQLGVDRLLGHLDLGLERLQAVAGAGGHHLAVAQDVAALDPQDVALARSRSITSGADLVDEGDAGRGQQEGPEVGVAAGDGPGGVDDRRRLGPDQALGRHPVEVLVVDHGDLARQQPGDQVLGPAVDPGPAGGDARVLGGGPAPSPLPSAPAPSRVGPRPRLAQAGGEPGPIAAASASAGRRRGRRGVVGGRPSGRAISGPARRDAVASSSSAWSWAVALDGWPDSIRDSSTTRSAPSRRADVGHRAAVAARPWSPPPGGRRRPPPGPGG